MGVCEVVHQHHHDGQTRILTDAEVVKAIYQDAEACTWNQFFEHIEHRESGDRYWFIARNNGKFRFDLLGEGTSKKEAWENARNAIEKRMLSKLEG